jgi:Flp pilus assembly pilin Flp
MFGVLFRLLKNHDGFTATEYGVIAAMIVIAVEQLASRL